MSSLAVFSFVACVVAAIAIYLACAKAHVDETAQLNRLRETALYQELHLKMSALRHLDIDTIRIEGSGITMTTVCPAHIVLDFKFKHNGNSLRNDAFTRLYTELIAEDFPIFMQKRIYTLHSYTVYRQNGRKEQAYSFIMQRGYKDLLLAERYALEIRAY